VSGWRATKARLVLNALPRIGWTAKRQTGSHKVLSRGSWPDLVFASHDRDEIGPRLLSRIARHSGIKPDDL
jgi:predicted RNA binding protein YcfA (HicA-like mRNA interferase family)